MNSFVTLDLETTGFSAKTSEIIEIGAWKVENGVVTSKFCTLVKPLGYIPRDVQALTGITNEMVASELSIEEVLPNFFDFCGNLPFLGHNLQFDYSFLCEKGKQMGLDFTLGGMRCGIDTCKLSAKYLTNTASNKLKDVADYFSINVQADSMSFHRAGFDAYMTKLIYDRFKYLFPNIPNVTNPDFLDKKDSKEYGRVVNDDTLSFT